jgi:hydrogenase expression/formation protein HypE
MRKEIITLAHGSGGAESASLMADIFAKHFNNEILERLEDSAVVPLDGAQKLAVSTDSFVVTPLFFPGGDIGKLAVCGTVNDVLMSGAEPRWLTCGVIIEAGLSIEMLDKACSSMASAAAEAGVAIIAGDTKVIEGHGEGGGLMINTTGIGFFEKKDESSSCSYPSPSGIQPGDAIIVSGPLGDHHATILSARLEIKNNIQSDCALLFPIINSLKDANISVHAKRDVTRGGLGTVLNELAKASTVSIEIEETKIPVNPEVRAFCGIMGLDPLYMGNEGKMVLAVSPEDADSALACIRGTEIGKDASLIGYAKPFSDSTFVTKRTRSGGTVRIDVLYGEGLPRIC